MSDSGMMKSAKVRMLLIGVGCVLILRLVWFSLSPSLPEPLMMDGTEQNFGKLLYKPKSCVLVDGKCIPEDEADINIPKKGLYTYRDSFYLDGKPFRILSGSFHYFRTQPAQWGDRLTKMKAAGLNTVMTYIPWNLHERVRGRYNFGGRWELTSFINQVHKVGLYLIIRPGPYICSEWEFGGLPSWLLSDPNMTVRSSKNKAFLKNVEEYFSKLLPLLSAYQYKKGRGPIIAFQIENEFGSYGEDPEYLTFLKRLYEEWGINELLFTSDGTRQLKKGTLPKVLATINFQRNAEKQLIALKKFQPNQPLMVTEFWDGWFDHWGETHHTYKVQDFTETVKLILKMNASINFYMFVGGTNFGFWNGANNKSKYEPTITSYDYDSPISEHGSLSPKFFVLRDLLKTQKLVETDLPAVRVITDTSPYGVVKMEHYIKYTDLLQLINPEERNILLDDVVPMEYLPINNKGGQGYGWILYQTNFKESDATQLTIKGIVTDRAQIFINDVPVHTTSHNTTKYEPEINIPLKGLTLTNNNNLSILVENMGRVNFGNTLDIQRKGIQGTLYIDGVKLSKWQHTALAFDYNFRQNLQMASWQPFEMPSKPQFFIPAVYRGSFDISGNPKDTFIWMRHWTRGIVIINGVNLGRYWSLGPQKALYVPAPLLLPGKNQVIVFELHQPFKQVDFLAGPMLQ